MRQLRTVGFVVVVGAVAIAGFASCGSSTGVARGSSSGTAGVPALSGGTPASVAQSPSTSPEDLLKEERDQLLAQALRGHVEFTPPTTMRVDKTVPVAATVRVDTDAVAKDLSNLQPGEVLVTVLAMRLALVPDPQEFKVVRVDGQPPTRPIDPVSRSATWKWDVTPLHTGRHPLALYAYVTLTGDKTLEVPASANQPVADPNILVKHNAVAEGERVLQWLKDYWIGGPIGLVLAALWHVIIRRRRPGQQPEPAAPPITVVLDVRDASPVHDADVRPALARRNGDHGS